MILRAMNEMASKLPDETLAQLNRVYTIVLQLQALFVVIDRQVLTPVASSRDNSQSKASPTLVAHC